MNRPFVCALALGLLLAMTPEPAYAYIDPGIGSLLFQSVIAGFIAVGAAWAGFKMKFREIIARRSERDRSKT